MPRAPNRPALAVIAISASGAPDTFAVSVPFHARQAPLPRTANSNGRRVRANAPSTPAAGALMLASTSNRLRSGSASSRSATVSPAVVRAFSRTLARPAIISAEPESLPLWRLPVTGASMRTTSIASAPTWMSNPGSSERRRSPGRSLGSLYSVANLLCIRVISSRFPSQRSGAHSRSTAGASKNSPVGS